MFFFSPKLSSPTHQPKSSFPCPLQENHFPTDPTNVWNRAQRIPPVLFDRPLILSIVQLTEAPDWLIMGEEGTTSSINTEHGGRQVSSLRLSLDLWKLLHSSHRRQETTRTCLCTQTSIFRTVWRSSSSGKNFNQHLESLKWLHSCWVCELNLWCFSLTGADCTCWRGSAAVEWRSWRLCWLNTCRVASQCQSCWRRPSASSRWGGRCCLTAVTPNTPETFYGCFPTRRTTWLLCASEEEEEELILLLCLTPPVLWHGGQMHYFQ